MCDLFQRQDDFLPGEVQQFFNQKYNVSVKVSYDEYKKKLPALTKPLQDNLKSFLKQPTALQITRQMPTLGVLLTEDGFQLALSNGKEMTLVEGLGFRSGKKYVFLPRCALTDKIENHDLLNDQNEPVSEYGLKKLLARTRQDMAKTPVEHKQGFNVRMVL